MPFEVKEPPKEKDCPHCGMPMTYEDRGKPCHMWRCTGCRYKETLVPLIVDFDSLKSLVSRL